MKKIYKYATGKEVPKGAIYLNTVTQIRDKDGNHCWYVWHYFLVEVKE